MPIISLPDGKTLNFQKEVTGLEIADKISKSLSKQALIMSVDGQLKDLYFSIDKDCSVKIFTSKDPEGLEVIRHDTAHIMAIICAVSCRITSKPSGSFEVKILTEQSLSIEKYKSFNWPSTLIISACFERDLLILSAISNPVTSFWKFKVFPSGNEIIGI